MLLMIFFACAWLGSLWSRKALANCNIDWSSETSTVFDARSASFFSSPPGSQSWANAANCANRTSATIAPMRFIVAPVSSLLFRWSDRVQLLKALRCDLQLAPCNAQRQHELL